MKTSSINRRYSAGFVFLLAFIFPVLLWYGCEVASSKANTPVAEAPQLPVIGVATKAATTYQEFSASLEGTRDVEIRPQVSGYLDQIFVDEGAYVKKGQPLFRIDNALYSQTLHHAEASLEVAKANLEQKEINLSKLDPLVQHQVVSGVQLKSAQAARDAAKASVEQAAAMVSTARINLGYTLIKAPVDGYIGRIPLKKGSLVETGAQDPLTTLSSVGHMYAYFSMSESDFLRFKHQFTGRTLADKIKEVPPVELVLGDDSLYGQKGRVETVLGAFDKTMGTISFRAIFPNANGLLRSGNTGRIRLPLSITGDVVIPQQSTYDLQDKVMVYALGSGNKVTGKPVTVAATSGHYYLISGGIKSGDRIVYTGLDRLHDGMVIQPTSVSLDSLLLTDPL